MSYTVFISHSSTDTWVARQVSQYVEALGAVTFLDEADVEFGDDFEERILDAARASDELLGLLTPWALKRPYIWLEIGAVWGLGRRIVGVLHGLTPNELVTQEGTPALLKRIDLVELNNIGNYSALQEAICGRNPSIRTICCGQIADLLSNKDSLQAVRA